MVLNPIIDGYHLTRVLMDGGSSLILIYQDTIRKMGIDPSRISQSNTTFEELFPIGRCDVREKSHSMWYSARRRIIGPKR